VVLASEGARKSGVVSSGGMGIVRGRGGPPVPRLIASGLACMRNEQVIIRDVNMTLHEGSGLIITGPNASGKSTFLRVLCGFIKPSAGRLLWDGVDLSQPGLYDWQCTGQMCIWLLQRMPSRRH